MYSEKFIPVVEMFLVVETFLIVDIFLVTVGCVLWVSGVRARGTGMGPR